MPDRVRMSNSDSYEPLDYKAIMPYFHGFTARQFLDFLLNDDLSEINGIKKLENEGHETFLLLPNEEVVAFYGVLGHYDLDDPDTLAQLIIPVIQNENGEYEEDTFFIDRVRWEPSSKDSRISMGGLPDFYERFGVWPHYEFRGQVHPLNYVGDFVVNGRRAYIFCDFAEYFFNDPTLSAQYGVVYRDEPENAPTVGIFEDDFRIPSWIQMLPLLGGPPFV